MWNLANKVDDANLAQAYREAANAVEDIVAQDLVRPQMSQHIAKLDAGQKSKFRPTKQDWDNWHSLEQWKRAREGWGKLLPSEKAVQANAAKRGGAFKTPDLVDAVGGKVPGSTLETEIGMGRKLMPEQLTDPSSWARLAALSKSGLGWAGTIGSLGTTAPIGRILAGKGTQKALFGDLAWQKELAKGLSKYGAEGKDLERLIRIQKIQGNE
jgi:hypothetical protein